MAPEVWCSGWLGARAAPALGKLFRYGVLVQARPRRLGGGRRLTGAPRRDLGHRGAGHRDCLAVGLDGVLVPAGPVGMIMVVSFPFRGTGVRKTVGTAGFEPATP